jgi:hypothetical protein
MPSTLKLRRNFSCDLDFQLRLEQSELETLAHVSRTGLRMRWSPEREANLFSKINHAPAYTKLSQNSDTMKLQDLPEV